MSNDYEEYLALCEEERQAFEKEENDRLCRKCFETEFSFFVKNGFESSIEKLVQYTLSKDIKWSYSRNASYYDDADERFSLVFVSDTLCVMELRGRKKGKSIFCKGFIKVNKKSSYVEFLQWKEIYSAIIADSEYFTIQNLLQKLKYKPRKLKENNWEKIISAKSADAIALEKRIRKYPKRNVYRPISYQKFLYEKYGIVYENIEIIKKIDERKIERFVHFTNVKNLDSILREGLLPVRQLRERGIEYTENDKDRLDNRLDASSLSVSAPNYKMFWHYRCMYPNDEWVVISYHAKLVADLNCAYFAKNAASDSSSDLVWKVSTRVKAFESMFKKERDGLYSYETTDPQAEVMVREIIPSEYIDEIFFKNGSLLAKYKKKYPEIKMSCKEVYFKPRRDFERWRKGHS